MTVNATVLAVDDNEAHRYFVSRTLEEAGMRPIAVRTGTEALEKAKDRPDLILLDVHLPDLDGFEVCRRLKADPATADIPIVMFSSISQSGAAVNDARQLGAAAFLFFPMVQDHLVSVVLGTLSASKSKTPTK
jgi:two-component system, sensor histidine kinase and response regulator